MACFLVTHRVGIDFAPDAYLEDEKKVIGHLPREIKWVMSWYLPEKQLLLAHWDAPSEQAVRVALERSGICTHLPILLIEPALEVYPKRYVARRNAAHAQHTREAHKKHTPKHRTLPHPSRELSGAYAESITSVLQARAGAHLPPVRSSN